MKFFAVIFLLTLLMTASTVIHAIGAPSLADMPSCSE